MPRARHARQVIAAIFLVLGGVCLLAPGLVLDFGVRPEFRREDLFETVLMACFGAQAVLAGLFAATSRFTATTFGLYGLALLPFFAFDWYFYAERPLLTAWVGFDALGNAIMLGACIVGRRALGATGDAA
jgi:hypothetical protein